MDSINFSQTQSAPLNWRNTASNTNPITCACCGSKDYTQNNSQANYFRILYPGMPRCKHSQNDFEDRCRSAPFFPTPPLLQPIFHNSMIPGYFCCSHYHLDDTAMALNQVGEQNKAESSNNKKVSPSGDCAFDQKVKQDSASDSDSLNENTKKHIGALGTDPQVSAHPFFFSNSMDPRLNAFQQCACGDSIPWTCSPFIIPIFSYCLFWNSQKHNKIFLSNYPGIQSEMKFQQHNERPSRNSSSNEGKEDNFKIIHRKDSVNSVGNKSALEDDMRIENLSKKETGDPIVHSQNFADNDSSSDIGKKKNCLSMRWNDLCVEAEAMDADSFTVDNQTDIDKFLCIDMRSPFHSKVHLSMDSDVDCLKENSSITFLEFQSKEDDLFESCDEPTFSKPDEGGCLSMKKSCRNIPDSNEECTQIKTEHQATNFEERMSCKNFIKDFTITDQASGKFAEEVCIANAAAGDIGGEHCVGYKVLIPPSEELQELDNRQKNKSETNLRTNESQLFKDLVELKEKKPEGCLEKNAETNKKNYRLKTGIAKNSSRISSQEIKDKKEPSQEEVTVAKRKHACFPSKDQIENSSNFQKLKNHTTIKQQDLGSGKLQKALTTKTQLFKRDEKISTSKALPHSMQTQTNATVKSIKK